MRIQPTRTYYRGIWFRSTLEADWAATFDTWGWYWEYEPIAVQLPNGEHYRPDFYLPDQRVWAEVKGPHNERIEKPALLQEALGYDAWKAFLDLADSEKGTPEQIEQGRRAYLEAFPVPKVVVLRAPGPGEAAQWHGVTRDENMTIVLCPDCGRSGFFDYNGPWICPQHLSGTETRKFWQEPEGEIYFPGELAFTRAPRPSRRAT